MVTVIKENIYTPEEYFALEEAGDVCHEFINGQIFEMSGASTEHYFAVKRIERLFESKFEAAGYFVFRENMKIKIHEDQKYFYPDVFISREANTPENRYAKNEPELIVEVASASTLKTDLVDKLIAYQKIPSLKYSLLVEPQEIQVVVFTKDKAGGWLSEAFKSVTDVIALPELTTELLLSEIYR